MKIKSINIYILKKNKISNEIPLPNFYNKGFVFFKIESTDGVYGLGEPNPYLGKNNEIAKKIHEIFLKYLKDKKIENINFNKIKLNIKNKILKSLISPFEKALLDILGKYKNKSVQRLISKNAVFSTSLDLYASGGTIFENKDYTSLIDEALLSRDEGFVGWKFRPKMPMSNKSHQFRLKNPPQFDVKELLKFSEKLSFSSLCL